MSDDSAVGTRVVAINAKRLGLAVEQLLSLEPNDLGKLRIKSGEHLAAILLTAFLGTPPHEVDKHGGVDFAFHVDLTREVNRLFSSRPLAAFEAKSLRGNFRHEFAKMEQIERDGGSSIGMGTSTTIRYAKDIMNSGIAQLRQSAEQLDRKLQNDCSRNSFLIVHPFEHFAVETVHATVMAPHMPKIPPDIDLDTVWVLWVPDHLTMWSRNRQEWIELLFAGFDPEDPDNCVYRDPDLSALQIASSELLSAMGAAHSDPYIFGFTTTTSDDTENVP